MTWLFTHWFSSYDGLTESEFRDEWIELVGHWFIGELIERTSKWFDFDQGDRELIWVLNDSTQLKPAT